MVTTYVEKRLSIQAMRATDQASRFEVSEWLTRNWHPFLVGDANNPETLRYQYQSEGDKTRPATGHYIGPVSGMLVVRTLEGDRPVPWGHYVVQDSNGGFSVVPPEVIEKNYEKA